MMHTAFSMGGARPRVRRVGTKIFLLALAGYFLSHCTVEAATCLLSAEAVRKEQPNAWPKWTKGSNGERCWYADKKRVFAKTPTQPPSAHKPMLQLKPVSPELDGKGSKPGLQLPLLPWALEYRWAEVFRYRD
jgi:hypothetical protein